jgi:hypothetical protein
MYIHAVFRRFFVVVGGGKIDIDKPRGYKLSLSRGSFFINYISLDEQVVMTQGGAKFSSKPKCSPAYHCILPP